VDDEFLEETLAHLDLVYNLARRFTDTPDDAEDLVQETFAKALDGWRRGRPQRVAPWLATICLNAARSRHRRRRSRPVEVFGTQAEAPATDETDRATDQLEIRRALDQLPAHEREAVVLMDLCGFTAAEVGRMLGAPRNTVLSRVHRGHKRLAQLLRETRREP
jgi:RNA polymerase sigma-70 factor (ECF subfamily)